MNPADHARLISLEKRIAAGERLPQEETRDLEALRDAAGQGSLPLGDRPRTLEDLLAREAARQKAKQREELDRRLAAPLRGSDAGEQESLFSGPGLLL